MLGWVHLDEPDPDLARRALSYLGVRRIIGLLGVALPVLLVVGDLLQGGEVRDSISAYYYTGMRGVLVGSLWTIGAFLLSYRYARLDDVLGDIACTGAVVVALFPTKRADAPTEWVSVVHFLAAAILFATFAIFCLLVFTKTAPHSRPSPVAVRRNRVYRACGVLIVVSIAVALLNWLGLVPVPLLVTESVAVWAFGAAWILKSVPLPGSQPPRGTRPIR